MISHPASFSRIIALLCICVSNIHCTNKANQQPPGLQTSVEVIDPALREIIKKDAAIETIADSLDWCEGPLWVESQQMLLFSDVPKNIIYKWTKEKGKEIYLTPSGYTGSAARGGETGSNGLGLDNEGKLVLCQHGDRRLAVMNAPLDLPAPAFISLANNYSGKKFNSPNDVAFLANGDIYFTDPPYGLEKNMDDPLKETPYQGIYQVSKAGEVTLMTDTITRPNGIAFFPDGKRVLIANSDPAKPYWYVYDLDESGRFTNGKIFYDAKPASLTAKGMPDGLKIDSQGNVFASGPGGIWIFDQTGKLLGKIRANTLLSNCSLSADEKTLYITADSYVLKADLR